MWHGEKTCTFCWYDINYRVITKRLRCLVAKRCILPFLFLPLPSALSFPFFIAKYMDFYANRSRKQNKWYFVERRDIVYRSTTLQNNVCRNDTRGNTFALSRNNSHCILCECNCERNISREQRQRQQKRQIPQTHIKYHFIAIFMSRVFIRMS